MVKRIHQFHHVPCLCMEWRGWLLCLNALVSIYPSVWYLQVSYEEGMKVMHVIKDGQVYKGVDSFQVLC